MSVKTTSFTSNIDPNALSDKGKAFYRFVYTQLLPALDAYLGGECIGVALTTVMIDADGGMSGKSMGVAKKCDCPPAERDEHARQVGELLLEGMQATVEHGKRSLRARPSAILDDPSAPPITIEEIDKLWAAAQKADKK